MKKINTISIQLIRKGVERSLPGHDRLCYRKLCILVPSSGHRNETMYL